MKITFDFSKDFLASLLNVLSIIWGVLVSYALARYYIDRQKREAEEVDRIMREQEQEQEQSDETFEDHDDTIEN